MDTDELAFQSVQSASALVKSGKVSPVELTQACLRRIEAHDRSVNAFITVTADSALAEARAAEAEVQRGGWRGPLHGIPIALKDMIDSAGTRTTAASALFEDRIPQADAAVVERLRRAGAILLGKLNMQEFAYGGTSVPSHYGPVRNPWDLECIAGGSSGGSAAAVAAGLCYASLGTDTGGSIREPAAFCGVVGMKATYGRVSNRGVIPLAFSLDHVGPLARNVQDCALVLDAIAGYDPRDVSSADRPLERCQDAAPRDLRGARIGIPREFFFADLDPQVRAAVDRALDVLCSLGAEPRDVPLAVSTDRTVFRAEAFAYHAAHIAESAQRYLPETLEKLRLGAGIDASGYIGARRRLAEQRRAMAGVFSAVDVLLTPTTPVPSPPLAQYPATFEGVLALEGSSILRNTRPFNMFGIPAITLPCGATDAGLPIGLQLAGPAWQERRLFDFARAFESATAWYARRPPLLER
jgi:aspartyl-tRNA(Asn)/glutamyl-tRNA(Gln) amidotransferase subunit A